MRRNPVPVYDADRQRMRWLLVLPPLLFTAAVYYPIGRNTFYSDDFLNLYNIVNAGLLEYLVTPNGGHVLVTRNAVFAATANIFGPTPGPFYWSAVLTHLLNVAVLFGVIDRFTQSARLACFGAAMWGISPLHEGTLGWYAVYGHALVGTFVLIILYQVAGLAAAGRPPSRRQLWLWYALALCAATSFGTGIGIALMLPFALHLLLPADGAAGVRRWPPLISLVVVVPLLYVGILWAYTALSGTPPFSQTPLILLSKPIASVLELWHLLALGVTRLVLVAYLPAWATPALWYMLLGGFALVVLAVAWSAAPVVRRRLAACALLLVACYGTVALGRGVILSGVPVNVFLALSRYHYVGQLLVTLMLCTVLRELGAAVSTRVSTIMLAGWYAVAVFLQVRFATPIDPHYEAARETERVLAAVQAAADAGPPGEAVYIRNRAFLSLPLGPSMFPGWAGVFAIFHPGDTIDGRRIFFIEGDAAALAAAQRGARSATLLVPPDAAPRRP